MKVDSKVFKYLTAMGSTSAIILSGSMLVAPWEGKVNSVYKDPVNILTSCYGHTGKELMVGDSFSDEECLAQLNKDLVKANKAVKSVVVVPLTPYQEAALTSFTYNVGEGKLKKSTMARKFNSLDYSGGCGELLKWVYAGGVRLKGLVLRREDEYKMCMSKTNEVMSYVRIDSNHNQ